MQLPRRGHLGVAPSHLTYLPGYDLGFLRLGFGGEAGTDGLQSVRRSGLDFRTTTLGTCRLDWRRRGCDGLREKRGVNGVSAEKGMTGFAEPPGPAACTPVLREPKWPWCPAGPRARGHRARPSPIVPSPSMQADLAAVNGSIQPDGFLSLGHRNARSQRGGERPAGCVFINQRPCPCGRQRRSARAGKRPPASAPTEPRLVWAGEGRPARPPGSARVASLPPPRATGEPSGYRRISDVVS